VFPILAQLDPSPFVQTLLSQSALVVLMGFVAYTLWKKLESAWLKIEQLAEALIKITLLWEERYSKESQDDRENKIILTEILEIIKNIRDGR
jgi:lambda repressor-like predicted transcriptional regulator